jgi:hypothetical protein
MHIEYTCIVCGKTVVKIRTPKNMLVPPKFCSQKCNGEYKRRNKKGPTPNVFFHCLQCGKEVATYRSPSARSSFTTKFCSLECLGKYQSGKGNPAWSGGKHKQNGYIVVFMPDHPYADCKGYVYEHRLVAEQKIGRYLKPNEVVHHINGDTAYNHPDNLMVFKNQGEHSKYHKEHKND